jgi:hypothetical protein
MQYRRPRIYAGTASAFAWNGLIDHAERLTGAGEREDAVRSPARPHQYQLEGAGTRSVMRSEERQQAGGIKEGEQSQVDHDLFRRGSLEDVLERPFDAADGRAVEFADQAQLRSRRRFVDGQLKVAWRSHGRLLSRAFREEQPKGRRGQTDPQAGTPQTLLRVDCAGAPSSRKRPLRRRNPVPVSRLVLFLESRYRGTKRVVFEQNDGALDATRMRP